jgi:ferredoxin
MAFVVTERCIQCKYTDCVRVCPMDCFMEGPNFLVINPDECIDCSMCVPECPVNAIVEENEIDVNHRHFIKINRDLSRRSGWKRIVQPQSPMKDHEKWGKVNGKIVLLELDWKTPK